MNQKFTSTIAGATIFISVIGLLSRGLGFFREMIFANNFGLEKEFDLYLVGAVLPITINTVILYIGQNFFIPEFQKISSTNLEEAQRDFKKSFITFIAAGTFISLLLFLTGDFIINFYMHSATSASRETATQVFNIFLLTIPFSAAISVLSALLQTFYEFKYPVISLLFLNLSIIVLLLFFSDRFGIYIIPVGYSVGTILQFGYLLIKSRKFITLNLLTQAGGYLLSKSILNSSIIIIILIESISQLYSIFDRYFYAYITPGGIVSLNYAYIIFLLPISIFSTSLATALFPKITQAINNSASNEVERIYNESISVNILIFMPMTFLFFYFGDIIIKLVFERGKFLAESTTITYTALMCYTVSLVFYSAYSVLNKIFYSIKLAKYLLAITIVGIIIKLAFSFLLVGEYHQYGLAVSTTISYLLFFIMSYLVLNKKLKIKNKSLFIKEFLIHFSNCSISLLTASIISDILSSGGILRELVIIVLFLLLFLLNLVLIKHKAIVFLNQVLQQLNFKTIA